MGNRIVLLFRRTRYGFCNCIRSCSCVWEYWIIPEAGSIIWKSFPKAKHGIWSYSSICPFIDINTNRAVTTRRNSIISRFSGQTKSCRRRRRLSKTFFADSEYNYFAFKTTRFICTDEYGVKNRLQSRFRVLDSMVVVIRRLCEFVKETDEKKIYVLFI